MKTQVKEVSKVNNSNKTNKVVSKEVKVDSIPTLSKSIVKVMDSIEKFDSLDNAEKSNFGRLLQVSRLNKIENLGLNKGLKQFLSIAKNELTNEQIKVLTFKNVCEYIKTSKFKDLPLFTSHQIVLICNNVVKAHDKATKLELKLAKQSKQLAKK